MALYVYRIPYIEGGGGNMNTFESHTGKYDDLKRGNVSNIYLSYNRSNQIVLKIITINVIPNYYFNNVSFWSAYELANGFPYVMSLVVN